MHDILIFRAGTYICAVPSDQVAELILLPSLIRLPGQPAILDGFLNLRGATVPVAPMLSLFLQPAPEPALHTPLIVIKMPNGLLALRVDTVEEAVALDDDALFSYAPADSLNDCAIAQFHWNGQEVALLSPERLLLTKERECIAGLQAQMQQRLENIEAPAA
jgi:purine-binding chemotaxis protein CheW